MRRRGRPGPFALSSMAIGRASGGSFLVANPFAKKLSRNARRIPNPLSWSKGITAPRSRVAELRPRRPQISGRRRARVLVARGRRFAEIGLVGEAVADDERSHRRG